MRRAGIYILLALIVAAAAAAVVQARRGAFRQNRLRYLANDHRYLEALNGYERLAAERGGDPLPGFEVGLLARARDYFRAMNMNAGSPEERAYRKFIDAAIARPNLADDARRLRLDLLAGRDGATTPTLAAAEAILERRYDPEALWWATRCRYDPARPLEIPNRLLEFAARLDRPTMAPAEIEPRQAARTRFLRAVSHLARQDWAGAAALIESGPPPERIDTDMALGVALLRAGRPEAALTPLERQRRLRPGDRLALQWLAEAYLGARAYPWALQAFRELTAIDQAAADRALGDAFRESGGADPYSALCNAAAQNHDVGLWSFLERLAPAEPRSGLAIEAATRMLALAPLPVGDLATISEAAIRRDNDVLLAGVETPLDKIVDPAAKALLAAIHDRKPLGQSRLGLFIDGNSTVRSIFSVPAGTRVLVIRIQGYPAGPVWPIVHLDFGIYGRRTVDAYESRAQARPFFIVLPETAGGAIELSAGVLNAGAGLNALIAEAKAY